MWQIVYQHVNKTVFKNHVRENHPNVVIEGNNRKYPKYKKDVKLYCAMNVAKVLLKRNFWVITYSESIRIGLLTVKNVLNSFKIGLILINISNLDNGIIQAAFTTY